MCVSNACAVQPKELGNYFIQLFLVLIALSMRKAQGRLHTKTIAATLRQSGAKEKSMLFFLFSYSTNANRRIALSISLSIL
jgi:hypothetical protein